jgi:hypothetical protein
MLLDLDLPSRMEYHPARNEYEDATGPKQVMMCVIVRSPLISVGKETETANRKAEQSRENHAWQTKTKTYQDNMTRIRNTRTR